MVFSHLVDFLQKPLLVVGAKVRHVHEIIRRDAQDLFAQTFGIREFRLRVRRKEAPDHSTNDLLGRKRWRHTHEKRLLARASEIIPDRRLGEGACIRRRHFFVRVIRAITKTIDTQLSRVFRRHRAHPRRHRDRRRRGFDLAPHTLRREPREIRHLGAIFVEDERRFSAVETDDENAALCG